MQANRITETRVVRTKREFGLWVALALCVSVMGGTFTSHVHAGDSNKVSGASSIKKGTLILDLIDADDDGGVAGTNCDDCGGDGVNTCAPGFVECDHGGTCICVFEANSPACGAGNTCATGTVCCENCSSATGSCMVPSGGCLTAVDCDDDDPCTSDSCNSNECDHQPIAGCCSTAADCLDADLCDGTELCTGSDCCVAHVGPGCDDAACEAIVCGEDPFCCEVSWDISCSPIAQEMCDICSHLVCAEGDPLDCSDDDPCTRDSCDSNLCFHDPIAGCCRTTADCIDADLCDGTEFCTASDCCVAHIGTGCDDPTCEAIVCEEDPFCCEVSWDISCSPIAQEMCDICSYLFCVEGDPLDCNDNDLCTTDSCAPATGCTHTDNISACDDGVDCTDDSCNPLSGCVSTPNNDNCDDGDACTSNICNSETGCEFPCTDEIDPVVVGTCPPTELTIECDQEVPPFEPQFTDNCDTNLEPTGITLTAPGDCPQERTIDRDAGVVDNCGNSAQCVQVVNVVDTTAPVVTCRELIVATCPGPNGIRPQDVPGLDQVSATDNCDQEVPVGVTLPQVFSPTCDGAPHVVTWSATDDCGNTGTCETRVRVIGGMCCPTVTDTDLKLMVTDLDLRQDTNGPVTTKARFDIWNSNEVRFSGTEKCITCWNETLISEYVAISNHFLVENLQTDKGKARIQNEGSDVCPDSEDSPLLGVAIKEHTFLGSPHVEMRSAITLPGEGEQAATILYDIIGEPEEANTGRTGGLTISQVPSSGTRPTGPQMDDGTTVLGDGVVADNRASTMFKGSLIAFPVIEVKWDRHGQLIQDTFIQILNDNPGEVKVQFYQVNGDSPLDAVIDPNTNEIIERAHPGWNWSDYQITLTGDESCYFSVATGQPKGVSPIAVLDPGNPNGRPDLDPSNPGGRLIRGFLAAWAVNDDQHEIRWNHLKGHATLVRYDHGTAFDYNPWNFRVVSGVPEGAESDATEGQLKLDGIEYDLAPETLIFDFYAAGATALTNPNVEIED